MVVVVSEDCGGEVSACVAWLACRGCVCVLSRMFFSAIALQVVLSEGGSEVESIWTVEEV